MTGPHPGAPAPGHGRQPRHRRRRAVLAGAVALLLATGLAACSTGLGAAEAPDAAAAGSALVLAPEADCLAPQVLTALGFDPAGYAGTAHPDAPEATPLPGGFTASSALLCSTGETLTDAAGRWAAVTATRLEGDVAPLVAALAAGATPDGVRQARAAAAACPADERRSDLWLLDALGAAVRVELPGGGCGNLPTAVANGITALDAVDVEHYPVDLVAPGASASPRPTAR